MPSADPSLGLELFERRRGHGTANLQASGQAARGRQPIPDPQLTAHRRGAQCVGKLNRQRNGCFAVQRDWQVIDAGGHKWPSIIMQKWLFKNATFGDRLECMTTGRPPLSPTARSTIRRKRERAQSDRAVLDAILDEALICHLAVVVDGAPLVVPTGYGREGDLLFLHGSTGARSLAAADGAEVCVAVTLLDGLIYARAAIHLSANYRSAVVHGRARVLTDPDQRMHGLQVVVEHMAPGSWDYARKPNAKELAATQVLSLDLTEAAVKIRSGGPDDYPDDIARGGVWAGVLPLRLAWGAPEPAADLDAAIAPPAHVASRTWQ